MPSSRVDVDLVAAADRAADLVRVDLGQAQTEADAVLAAAGEAGNVEAASVAERLLGLVALYEGRAVEGRPHAERAVALAAAAQLREREGEARLTLLAVLAYTGAIEQSHREAELAAGLLRGPVPLARLEIQHASVYRLEDRYAEALACYDRALATAAGHLDETTAAILHHNRGSVLAELGDVRGARAELALAADLELAAGNRVDYLGTIAHVAKLAAQEGDLPAALALFDELRQEPQLSPWTALDLAECFLLGRLADDARRAARLAVEVCFEGLPEHIPVAQLYEARAEVLAGDYEWAGELAGSSAAALEASGRTGWAAMARLTELAAHVSGGEPDMADGAVELVDRLSAIGMTEAAVEAGLLAGRTLLALGRRDEATAQLERAATAGHRSPLVQTRAAASAARALALDTADQPQAARTVLARALNLLDDHLAALGSTELQASYLETGRTLSQLGLAMAAETSRPETMLDWAERTRAARHRLVRVRPPEDPELRRLLTELRGAATAEAKGEPAAVRRRGQLEQAVRQRARIAGGIAHARRPARPSEIRAQLGRRVLVELVTVDHESTAIVLSRRRARVVPLLPDRLIVSAARALQRRLALVAAAPDEDAQERNLAFADELAERLDDMLLYHLRPLADDVHVVVVPSSTTANLPWSALPVFRDRPFTVAPSATLWARSTAKPPTRRRRSRRVAAVAGPHLEFAADEVEAVAGRHPRTMTLAGEAATVDAVLDALGDADIAHIAAHGEFRGDNPLLSALRLSDGPLTIYDLELLDRLPELVVLSACEVGRSSERAGEELLGVAATLLQLGTRTVIGATGPVPDAVLPAVADDLHRHLARGVAPSVALAAVRAAAFDPLTVAATRQLVCFGAG